MNIFPGFLGSIAKKHPSWNPNNYTQSLSLSISSTETNVRGLTFKMDDGTKVFYCGNTTDKIRSYDLPTGWSLSGAINPKTSPTLYATDGTTLLSEPSSIDFINDGTAVYVTDATYLTNGGLFKFNLSTAWDVSTINGTASQQTTVITSSGATQTITPHGIRVSPDGLNLISCNIGTSIRLSQWSMTVANDLSTLTFERTASISATPHTGLSISGDGTKLFVIVQGVNDNLIYWNLASPWNISGITSDNFIAVRNMNEFDTACQDVYVRNDGLRYYIVGSSNDAIQQFNLL